MSKYRLQLLAAVAMTIGFFALLGWAGDYDHTEQIILNMSYDEYDYVRDSLTRRDGTSPSERQIAHWYSEHYRELTQLWP